jgi:hypothetical protein
MSIRVSSWVTPVGALDPDSLGIEADAAAAPLGLDAT